MKIYAGKCEIPIVRKKIKRLRMRIIAKTGEPEISAPIGIPISEIEYFVHENLSWIEKHSIKVKERKAKKDALRNLKDNDKVTLWGQEFYLKLIESAKKSTVSVDRDYIILKVPPNSDIDKKNKVLDRLYKRELEDFILEILPKWGKIIHEHVREIKYRNMKSKWGSCMPYKGIITLNTKLAKMPEDCAEMVLVHELIHFKEIYHNDRFKSYMTKYLPNWNEIHKKIKDLSC